MPCPQWNRTGVSGPQQKTGFHDAIYLIQVDGLKGDEIPLLARVVGVLGAYGAMVSDRPYRKAISKSQVIAELRQGAGSQFDQKIVDVFIEQLQQ